MILNIVNCSWNLEIIDVLRRLIIGTGGVVTPSLWGTVRIDGYVTPSSWVTVMADGVVIPSLWVTVGAEGVVTPSSWSILLVREYILVPKQLSVVVPLGGAVVNKQIGKTPNMPSPSAATEVGLEVLELGVVPR